MNYLISYKHPFQLSQLITLIYGYFRSAPKPRHLVQLSQLNYILGLVK